MAIEFVTSLSTVAAAADSIFIPSTDLNGLLNTSLDAVDTATGNSLVVSSVLSTLASMSPTYPGLRFNAVAGNPSGSSGLLNITYTLTASIMSSLDTKAVTMLPLPTIGTNSGEGGVAFTDIFPNAVKVASAADYPAFGGVGIPTADLVPFFGTSYATTTLANDSRHTLMALVAYLIEGMSVRSVGTASALISKSRSAPVNFVVPASYTDATNPLSDITTAMLPKIACSTITYAGTVQYNLLTASNTLTYRTVTL